ncbi:THYLAKOID FORMATION1, chloroplastic-like protein, partial [Drosera capensis]
MAAAATSVSFSASAKLRAPSSSTNRIPAYSESYGVRLRSGVSFGQAASVRVSSSSSSVVVVRCVSDGAASAGCVSSYFIEYSDIPTVAQTKLNFLQAYKRPIPSIYNNVLQELIVQQHLMRYKKNYKYGPVFALGFVTVYDQLMEGYPSEEDQTAIFEAYINALNESPEQYRKDARKLEDWARLQTPDSLVDFSSRDGETEAVLKDIAARAGTKSFSYSRFFAIGLFRILELSNATEPTVLEKLCAALNVDKRSVDRDLDVYRNLLTKLVQAKELLREYVDRNHPWLWLSPDAPGQITMEKKKREERVQSQKASEAKMYTADGNDAVGIPCSYVLCAHSTEIWSEVYDEIETLMLIITCCISTIWSAIDVYAKYLTVTAKPSL